MKPNNCICTVGGLDGGQYYVTFENNGCEIKVYDEHITVEFVGDNKVYSEYDLLAAADSARETNDFFDAIGLLDEVVPLKNESFYALRDMTVQHRMMLTMVQRPGVFKSKYVAANPYFREVMLGRILRARKNRWHPEIMPEHADILDYLHRNLTHEIE